MAEAKVKIGIQTSAFTRGLDTMQSQAKAWGKQMTSILGGAFAIGTVTRFVSGFLNEMDRVGKLAERLNVLPSTIEKIGHSAELAGTDVETVVKAMTRLTVEASKNAAAFEEVGISATDFVNADIEQKIIMFSRAMVQAQGDTAKQVKLIDLLGARAQNMIPYLLQGPEALIESMGKANLAIDVTSRSIQDFNDTLTKIGRAAKQSFGSVLGIIQQIGAFSSEFAKTMSFEKAMLAVARLQEAVDKQASSLKKNREEANLNAAATEAMAEAQKKAAEETEKLTKLQEEMAKTLKDRAFERLTTEEQILAIQREQMEVMRAMSDPTLTELGVAEKQKELLEFEQKLEKARDEQGKSDKAAMDERLKMETEIAEAQARVAEEEDKQALAAMDPAARAKELKSRQAGLFAASKEASIMGDDKQAAELRLQGLQLSDAIEAAIKESMPEAVTEGVEKGSSLGVVTSTLGSVGGGGGSFVTGMNHELRELQNQTQLLQRIANSVSTPTTGGTRTGEIF